MNHHPERILAENRKAMHDYEIIEEFEAGIVLFGPEVKSLRLHHANLRWSYITLHTGTPLLFGCHIWTYAYNTGKILDPKRERQLLLKQKEILRLSQKVKEMGATIVPVEIYTKGSLIKVRIALAKGRKKWQKKQVLKERDISREVRKNSLYA